MLIDLQPGALADALTGERWTRAETRKQIEHRIAAYHGLGLRPGQRVMLLFGNRREFFADLLSLWRLGACAIPVDARLTAFELRNLVDATGPRLVIVDEHSKREHLDVLGESTVVHTGETSPSRAGTKILPGLPQLDHEALILFTSGTTGEPKGVVHTHRSLRARWLSLEQAFDRRAFRRSLCLLPTHFGHGLICNCLFPWLGGADLFIGPPFDLPVITELGRLIDEHDISFLSSVPALWRLATRSARPPAGGSLERVHVGSAPLSAALWEQVQAWAGTDQVINAYGITETGSWVAGTSATEPVVPADGLVGQPWGAKVRILSARDTSEALHPDMACAPGETGMIWLNTPALMSGYFQRPELTAQVVSSGWFMTGDIGALDERGQLWLRGRERDEINKGGMKVYPADVDSVVERFTAVADVCTFAFADPLYGENIGMAVVLQDDGPGQLRGLSAWIADHLAEHKRPVRWYLLKEIPRTDRGKINRARVMEACQSQEAVDPQALSTPPGKPG